MTDLQSGIEAGSDVRAIEYCVLGQLEVRVAGTPAALGGRKQRGVLAMLIAWSGHPVSVDTLLLATYGDDASSGAKATLHTYVSNLRRVIGDVVVRQGDAYFLDCNSATIDTSVFEQACARAAIFDDPERSAAEYRQALSLWRGHAYSDIEVNGHLDGEITRLNELRLAALDARIDADLRAGRHREVVGELDALSVEHPYREHLRELHMLALYRCGRQAEALRAYARTRDLLVEDLGIDPSPDLQQLEARILAQDRALLIDTGTTIQRRAVLVADVDDSGWRDPWARDGAYNRRDDDLSAVAASEGGTKLSPRGTAGYVLFAEPISAVRAARAIVNDRTRIAIDVGDLELDDDEPAGPPLARAARLVATAHPGQAILSSAAHDALAVNGETGWAAESLGRFDIVGLDPGAHIYQLVGKGFGVDFPPLRVDRLPPPVPGGTERSVPGYELRQLIGAGQLGEVHRAYQPSVGREVAVRIFGRSMVSHPQFVRRFELAAQRITRVEHPHLVPLLDYWREPTRAVMVSRLLTGGHLGDRIPPDGFEQAHAMEIVETIASAITSAHRHGVVHGRIRPENVLFDAEDNAFVADLGIDEICAGIITFASSAYDAPERLGGALATPASDVYSLGVLVQHLMSGAPPSPDRALDVAGSSVATVIARATDADPGRRQQSVEELTEELREVCPAPARRQSAFVPSRNPYRGLEAFEQADSADFHGRQRSVAEMVAVLGREPVMIVVGPSGTGKSSVVKAGLLPALAQGAIPRAESWLVSEMVPGRAPMESLAAALARVATGDGPDVVGSLLSGARSLCSVVEELAPASAGTLIVVDQLEELFTQTIDELERRAFLQLIVDLAQTPEATVRIVATLRADYFDRPLAYPGVDEAVQGRTVAIGALSSQELADAITLPAAALGVRIEQAVVDRIVAEADLQPGALPLVQHTLSELFAAATSNVITASDLDRVGGVTGSIGRRAEQIYDSLDDEGRAAAQSIFLRLVSVTEEHGDTRRRVRRTELEQAGLAGQQLDAVLAAFGAHRLLTFDRDPASRTPTVELAHEALLTDWTRFARWVDEARDDLLARRRVETATSDWIASDADDSFLYSGGRLDLAEAWAAESRFQLGDDEVRFLQASRTKVDRDRAKRTRRRRAIVAVLAVATVAALTMAAIAFVQRGHADRSADEARARELAGLATQTLDEDPERAILLALAAVHRSDEQPAEAISALQQATQATRVVSAIDLDTFGDIAQNRDGSLLAVPGADRKHILLVNSLTGRTETEITTATPVTDFGLTFAPTSSILAVTHDAPDEGSAAVELIDVRSGERVGTLPRSPDFPFYCCGSQFDPTGHWFGTLALADDDSPFTPVVWDLAGGPPKSFGPADDFELGTDGKTIIVWHDRKLTIFDIATGEQVRQIETPAGIDYWFVERNPTGSLMALVSPYDVARRIDIVDMTSGEVRNTLDLRDPGPVRFSPDGHEMAVMSGDGLIHVFETDRFTEIARLAGSPGPSTQVLFNPDGSRLITAGNGEISTWDMSAVGPQAPHNFAVSGGALAGLVVSGSESTAYAIVYSDDGTHSSIHRIAIRSGIDVVVTGNVPYYFSTRPRVAPDLSVMATLDADFITHVVPLPSGEPWQLQPCDSVRAFSSNGRLAAIDAHLVCNERGQGFGSGHSRIVDLQTRRNLLDLGDELVLYAAAFGPPDDSGLPASVAVIDATTAAITLYDLTTGQVISTYTPDAWIVSMTMSPEGRRIALLLETGHLVVLDIEQLVHEDPQRAVIFDIVAHSAGSHSVAYSDSGLIATGSTLDGIKVWSPAGTLVASIPTRQTDEPTFAFAQYSDTLYYEDGGGVVRRFPIDVTELERLARALLTRGFTEQECNQYFPGEDCPAFDQSAGASG